MHPMPSRRTLIAAVCLVAAAVVAAGAYTARITAAPTPALVALVDLNQVVNQLNERTRRQEDLSTQKASLQDRLDDLAAEITNEQQKYELLPAGAEQEASREKLQKLTFQLEFEKQYSERTLAVAEGTALARLYEKISGAVAEIAAQNGYTLVMVNDSAMVVPRRGTAAEITAAIFQKRVLFAADAHDITQEVITYMNNQFAAGTTPKP